MEIRESLTAGGYQRDLVESMLSDFTGQDLEGFSIAFEQGRDVSAHTFSDIEVTEFLSQFLNNLHESSSKRERMLATLGFVAGFSFYRKDRK